MSEVCAIVVVYEVKLNARISSNYGLYNLYAKSDIPVAHTFKMPDDFCHTNICRNQDFQ